MTAPNTVFDLITAPALITAPPDFIFTYYRPLDNLFPDFSFIFTYYHPLDDLLALVVEDKFTLVPRAPIRSNTVACLPFYKFWSLHLDLYQNFMYMQQFI